MAYFVVQVQTNFEKYVLSVLTDLLLKKKINIVSSIYAIDTKVDFQKTINLDNDNIREYLKQSRIRNYLSNMRYAYYQLNTNDEKNQTLKEAYKQQIKELNKEISKYPTTRNNKETPFIRGYIIIEVKGDFEKIPSDLYHDIKSIPKVVSIPNKYNVPEEEIKFYFDNITEEIAY
ncbi:transcription termination/antitermination NusG family protein [Gracilibacillus thailandensis]|uniref:NusG-like N-terminal domain-containing protein n=1 Tax=Gracilibacillus thailandensis TaxID=563735 RepID=A0A6N7R309_9BACI|nr:transcription termination/antitermination NusG family protein [Gracilibacillus thailandensis]MRI66136.1 hypothetical protein [Gracilibacillus thailandensis]